jgi:beta-glucosidase
MQAFDMKDYNMSAPPGRTYRYFTGDPIYPFGYGLSLTTFELDCRCQSHESIRLECTVRNTGGLWGDEVVQVYHSVGADISEKVNHPVPIKHLVDFSRVRIAPGDTKSVVFVFDEKVFLLVNESGDKVVHTGTHKLSVTNGVQSAIEFLFQLPLQNLRTNQKA